MCEVCLWRKAGCLSKRERRKSLCTSDDYGEDSVVEPEDEDNTGDRSGRAVLSSPTRASLNQKRELERRRGRDKQCLDSGWMPAAR